MTKEKELKEKLYAIRADVIQLTNNIDLNTDVDVNRTYKHALDLLHHANDLVEKLEDIDLDEVKIPSIDSLFENNPVTDYINAMFNYVEGKEGAKEELVEAAKKVAAEQGYELEEPELENDDSEFESLYDFVHWLDGVHALEIGEALEAVEEHLNNKDVFDEADLELIKYYFKHQPNNSDYDIEALSDKALTLAWRHKQFLETIGGGMLY